MNIVVNGDMERNDVWMFGDSPVPAKYTGAQFRSGLRSVQMGILPGDGWHGNSYSSVRQLVTIPSGATTAQLRWWRLYRSEEPPNANPGSHSDRQEVILLTPHGKTLRILDRVRRNDGVWQESAVDLTEFVGQTFYVYFNTYNDMNPARTWMFLDDVSISVCSPQPMPIPQPYESGSMGAQPLPAAQYSGEQPMGPPQPQTQPMYGSQAVGVSQPTAVQPMGQSPAAGQSMGQPLPTGQGMAPPETTGQPMGQTMDGPQPLEGAQPYAVVPATLMPMATPTPTATETATSAPVDMSGSATSVPSVPGVLAATPLPAIPVDTIEALVLRVIDGQTIEVMITGEIGPDAVHDSIVPETIPTSIRTASVGGVSIFQWRNNSRREPQVAQAELAGITMVVRYADIEAPSIDTEAGIASAAANRELVDGETVYLEILDTTPDEDGAVPAYVFLPDGELVNAAMVRQGFAVVAPSVADSKYEARLLAAQTLAQETASGMWQLAPTLPDEVVATLVATVTLEAVAEPAETPTAPAPPTATPAKVAATASEPCVELVRNGSFEEGDVYWNLIEGARPPVITDEVAFPYGGHSLRLGIVDGENVASISAADQLVELPDDAYSIVLSLRYYPIADGEPGPGDLQYIDIYNALTGQFAGRVLSGQRNDAVWLAANYDLSLLAGQPIRVVFAVNNDGVAGTSSMYVDDVSILACDLPPTPGGPGPEPDQGDEGVGAEATATLQTVLASQNGTAPLSGSRSWLSTMFTGAVMLGILTIIGFAALVIMNSSTSGGSGGKKSDDEKSGGDSDDSA